MVTAMIAKKLSYGVRAVGSIELSENGFRFKAKDVVLRNILRKLRRTGIDVVVPAVRDEGGTSRTTIETVPITESVIGPLADELLENGYDWWQELPTEE